MCLTTLFISFLRSHNQLEVFKYVQVATAICDAFAHGANDVANAMGPFEIIVATYIHGRIQTHKALGNSEWM